MFLYIQQHFLNVIIMSTIETLMFYSSSSVASLLGELLLSLSKLFKVSKLV